MTSLNSHSDNRQKQKFEAGGIIRANKEHFNRIASYSQEDPRWIALAKRYIFNLQITHLRLINYL